MYPHLNAPLKIGGLLLPNRIVMGSMHLGFESEADGPKRLAEFYAERARGGVGLIVTGGVSPNPAGRFDADGPLLDSEDKLAQHLPVTEAVHKAGGRIVMQILHTGRYGQHEQIVAPSSLQAPISRTAPKEMTPDEIKATVADFARTAALAEKAGYDGVEVMASEGYLLSEFLAPRTNKRTDAYGGPLENRMRILVDVVRGIRQSVQNDFVLMVRLTVADLVEDGLSADEVLSIAKALEAAGADVLSTGIGWHESRIPTIAHMVPAGGWRWAAARVKAAVKIPVVASNRINTPELAEEIIAKGEADLVALARPMLADAEFAAKAARGDGSAINVCIGCNQGCLDAMFNGQWCTCLVNPRAGRETDMPVRPAAHVKNLAVVGAGPAGLAFAAMSARRGHKVTLFEASRELGGQFVLARKIPGKEDYLATPRYFAAELQGLGVEIKLGKQADVGDLASFDEIILASGTTPRRLDLPGSDLSLVADYEEILSGRRKAGAKVVILGSGGIGHDVAAYLLKETVESETFDQTWGVDPTFAKAGALADAPPPPPPCRRIVMMQRKPGKGGAGLGKTTGWIHRALLARYGVKMLTGVAYREIKENGIEIGLGDKTEFVEADTIIACIGQEPRSVLAEPLRQLGKTVHLIGGADEAAGLDARKAILAGTELGLRI